MNKTKLEITIDTSAVFKDKWILAIGLDEPDRELDDNIRSIVNFVSCSLIQYLTDTDTDIELTCSGDGLAYALYKLSFRYDISILN